ncbi:hypothetical protein [Mycolicibacter arupensis]|uniref:Scaffolding protein n=1 Tax=Mycolicibacter arupensis TaxID=342002 RepID=A0A5C7Y3K7_9MYCO|nr:hypothetical protein [Mycolicibacter arupensis]TXI56485.1 MAG: hypothetical protein E6Q54_10460 [Mycolicibacter arupensis]
MSDADTTPTEAEVADTPTTEVQPEPESAEREPDPATDAAEPTADDAQQEFSRDYVEKLRKESAGYRERATTAENTVAALQQQHAERLIDAAGVKPAAVFALTTITDLLADDGTVDPEKVTAAVTRARQELGVTGRPQPLRPQGGLTSGTGAPKVQKGWQSAFAPPER